MKQKDLLFILVSSTLLVLLWIVFSIVHQSITSTISDTLSANIAPINGTFDTKTLTNLKNRKNINPQSGIAITPTATPTPTVPPLKAINPLQSLSVPVATQGGSQ